MGEMMIITDQSMNKVLDIIKKDGLDEEHAIEKKIISLSIRYYIVRAL